MPPQQNKPAPDFIPAEQPDFIPADSGTSTDAGAPQAETPLTGLVPHQSDTLPHALTDVFSNIGGSGLGALEQMGRLTPFGMAADKMEGKPTIYGQAYDAVTHPADTAKSARSAFADMAHHPLETIEGGIGAAGAGAMIDPEATFLDKIPSKGRAANAFADIANKAQDVPVSMTATQPAVEGFRDFVNTGGRNARVMTKLGKRLDTGEPVNFPEARQFYSNVSEASARPGFLRRAIESPSAPKSRYQLGGVREAMNSDLTNALPPELSDRYTNALREYAQAAKLGKVAKGAGAVALGEGVRRTGIFGKIMNSAAQ